MNTRDRRIIHELRDLEGLDFLRNIRYNAETYTLLLELIPPKDSPYDLDGNTLTIEIMYPEWYPFSEPIVTFMTPIYHPNVDDQNVFHFSEWCSSMGTKSLLLHIVLMLDNPLLFQHDCGDQRKRKLFRTNPRGYRKKAIRGHTPEKMFFLQTIRRLHRDAPQPRVALLPPSQAQIQAQDSQAPPLREIVAGILGFNRDTARELWSLTGLDSYTPARLNKSYRFVRQEFVLTCLERVLDPYRENLPLIHRILEEMRDELGSLYPLLRVRYR